MKFYLRIFFFPFVLFAPVLALAIDNSSYLAASKQFDQLVEQSLAKGSLPRLSDTESAKIISVLSDSERFLNAASFQLADLEALGAVCDKAQSVTAPYLFLGLFDLRKELDSEKDPQVAAKKISALVEKNTLTFQDELERLQPFTFRCLAKQIPLMAQFLASLPSEQLTDVRRAGARQMRGGISQMYLGVLQLANSNVYSFSYRIKLLEALAETAPVYSSALTPDARKQISDFAFYAKTIATLIPASAPSGDSANVVKFLSQISDAMAGSTCEKLCAI
ncbi:MAG: hypothetical protein Q7U94_08190 [Sideroxyarcus sp.]|nr:hypothetical protein [Sideroxyarcus sp.]